ncbi:hypothetical protein FQS07_01295 [Listeria innocua]|uniref:hypothetical protein n=2 Tax=Listeria innocua TaxID=1642 RepID=UPI001388240B|nr:hypothetical protein [Listeria innocua]EDO1150855.1 hypothetical protein [Listeria innocua]EHF3643534.1 hypothetical protein [Listeria innocua]EIL5149482.1 hypothetical protein [Listeria innocua]EIL5152288.1 hypothetical protein [Listeria innocua]EIL5180077.1 hypothetical protein [Listeria innocua]
MKITRTKRLVLMLLILVLLYLLMYSLTNDWKTSSHKHKETTIITNLQTTKIGDNGTITKQTITNDDSEDVRLSYYSTIEDAVKNNTFAKDSDAKDSPNLNKKVIKEKVLLLENEKNAILFFIGNVRESNNHKDSLVVYKFKVKEEGSTKKYSTPTNATQISGVFAKNNYEIRDGEYEIQTCLNLYNTYQIFNLYPETSQLQWGTSYNKNAPNLTINGKHPTKVIPIELDGDDCYFWYYEDLKYDSSKKAKISFKKTK